MGIEDQPREPTFEDDGFSPEERAQYEAMRTEAAIEPPAAPADGAAPDAEVAAAAAAAAAGTPEAPLVTDPDDDDDEPGDGQAAANPDPNAPKPPRRVAYSKYRRAEDKLKQNEKELATFREQQARLDERLKIINEALTTPPAPVQTPAEQDPEPDPEQDIFGHNQWLKRQLVRVNQTVTDMQQGRQAESQNNDLARAYANDAMTFAAREPAFNAAYAHLMESRVLELAMYKFGKDLTEPDAALTPQETDWIRTTFQGEERQLAAEALRNNQSPAQRVFQLAKARGFRPAAAAAAPAGTAAPAKAPAAPPAAGTRPTASAAPPLAAPAAPAPSSVTEEIARIQAGQAAALSLSNGGGQPQTPMTAERLANMSTAEFADWMENTPPEIQRQLLGG